MSHGKTPTIVIPENRVLMVTTVSVIFLYERVSKETILRRSIGVWRTPSDRPTSVNVNPKSFPSVMTRVESPNNQTGFWVNSALLGMFFTNLFNVFKFLGSVLTFAKKSSKTTSHFPYPTSRRKDRVSFSIVCLCVDGVYKSFNNCPRDFPLSR